VWSGVERGSPLSLLEHGPPVASFDGGGERVVFVVFPAWKKNFTHMNACRYAWSDGGPMMIVYVMSTRPWILGPNLCSWAVLAYGAHNHSTIYGLVSL
jgi:hypothetical protein